MVGRECQKFKDAINFECFRSIFRLQDLVDDSTLDKNLNVYIVQLFVQSGVKM